VKLLLDTHVLLWWLHDASRLRPETRALFADMAHEMFWSAASTWELAIKLQLGKVRLHEPLPSFVARVLAEQSLCALPIHHAHAAKVAEPPPLHRDPIDRLLVAQAAVEQLQLLTADPQIAAYGVACVSA
jgi:PIN domain nuclease of toxin-antitoxin system